MDLYCQRCGEPFDIFSLQEDMTEEEAQNFRSGEGCPCCFGQEVERQPFRAQLAAALADILGDDIDGLAAEMDDAEHVLGGKFWE